MSRRFSCGFTLVEMLVVIAMIGVLVALLLPAVQGARERARRAECQNNLMQLGLALQHYEDAYRHLPAGVVNPGGPIESVQQGKHFSWAVALLPYLEQGNTYNHIDFEAGVYDRENLSVRQLGINPLVCPSDINSGDPIGYSNYAACHHDVEAPIAADNQGVFFLNSQVRYDQITDGRSHTIFIGEKLIDQDAVLPPGLLPDGMEGAMPWDEAQGAPVEPFEPEAAAGQAPEAEGASAAAEAEGATGEPTEPPGGEVPPSEAGEEWGSDNAFFLMPDEFAAADNGRPRDLGWMSGTRATLRNTGRPINRTGGGRWSGPGKVEDPNVGDPLWVGGFESRHVGGAQFLLGDGSVRFLSQQISPGVYQQLGHRADGKLLNDADY